MPTEPKVVAVIPARWASSRFPGKPLAPIRGRPMIQWVVDQARKARSVSEVIVATDHPKIFDRVKEFGGKVIMTSESHASGTDRIGEVIRDMPCDIVVNVQGDEPLTPPENIDLVVQPLLSATEVSVSTLMIRIRSMEEVFDPNITKVVVNHRGFALYFSRAPIPYDRDGWPSPVPETGAEESGAVPFNCYKHFGLYAYTRSFLLDYGRLPASPLEKIEKLEQLRILENGFAIKVMETDKDSIGVDREEDLKTVERLLECRAVNE